MNRFLIVVLMVACVGLGSRSFVYAGTDLGQHCFQIVGEQVATLRVSAVQASGSELIVEIHGRWRGIANANPYQLLGAGTFTQSHPLDSAWSMGLTFANPSGAFNENSMCSLHAKLDGGLNGSWFLDCLGLGVPPLSVTGTMTYVACTSAM